MRRLLVLRPEPGASETAARARTEGWEPIVAPLFETRGVAWEPPDPAGFDAVMLTSAASLRHAGAALARYRRLPALAVGAATAAAARDAGFADVRISGGDAVALLELARGQGLVRLLHLAGREHRAAALPGVEPTRVVVYAAEPLPPPSLPPVAVALVHSPRAGRRLADVATDDFRRSTRLAAISAAAADAAGKGWAALAVADRPDDAALLAAAASLCDQAGSGE